MDDLRDVNIENLTDSELRALLDLPEGKDGLRYYMSKPDKVTYLRTKSAKGRKEILDRARKAQNDHHAYLRNRRAAGGSPDKQALIEQKMGAEQWRYIRKTRTSAGFRDDVTGRKARVAYELQGVTSGKTLTVTKSTVQDAFERLANVTNWPPPRGVTAAVAAGPPTGRDLGDF